VTSDAEHPIESAVEPAATAPPPPRPPLWRRVFKIALAVGVLIGLAEVCWAYRVHDIAPEWQSSLPVDWVGLGLFVLLAVVTDCLVALVVGVAWGALLAVYRDVTASGAAKPDRRFAVAWGILSAGLIFLWLGWVAFYVFPSTAFGTLRYTLTLLAGAVAALLLSAGCVWSMNRVRRWHPSLPTIGWGIAVLGMFLLTLPAFSRYGAREQDRTEVPIAVEGTGTNVLLITLDTLRYDHVACNGVIPWIKTPTLDALAADGIRFEQAISQSPTTTPAHCSLMTGVYPNIHGAMNGKPMVATLATLAECLRENGYGTIAFTSATTTRSVNTGLDRGFERYVDSLVGWSELLGRDEFQNLVAFYALGVLQDSQIDGSIVNRRALRWFATRSAEPFFCWLHYFDPHDPYDPPPPYDQMYAGRIGSSQPEPEARAAYAGEVTYVDSLVGDIIDDLKRRDLYDHTLIVVVADHGEGFGEKHWSYVEKGHGDHLYDTTQRVPLIVKPPVSSGFASGKTVRAQVELIDLAPTILDCVQLPRPASFTGVSLVDLLAGKRQRGPSRPAHAMAWAEVYDPKNPDQPGVFVRKWAHRTPDWKYVLVDHYEQEELYDLRRDPAERDNVRKAHPRICAQRKSAIRETLPEKYDMFQDPRARLAPALRRQLEALGYLGTRDVPQTETNDD
jgi:arylsulfatase A-like enzyme